jgi:hypothetical protein
LPPPFVTEQGTRPAAILDVEDRCPGKATTLRTCGRCMGGTRKDRVQKTLACCRAGGLASM